MNRDIMFSIQPTSKSERERYGEFVVRVVAQNVFAPSNDTMDLLEDLVPHGGDISLSTKDGEGYGRVAYVHCESNTQKRRTELAIEGKGGIADLIDNLRKWVALHSFLYYKKNEPAISDEAWDRKARKLARVQHTHGYDAGSWQNEAFEDFTGDTGYHLPFTDEIRQKAIELIEESDDGQS